MKKSTQFSVGGFLLGVTAPMGWTAIRMICFYDSRQSFLGQLFSDIIKNGEQFALYCYMGGGTALVLSTLGYLIGKSGDELLERAAELDVLHKEVEAQKEIFENRYKVLDTNIKNFHQISSKIQISLNLQEILVLCAEGLHEVLGYERVNILMLDGSKHLRFITNVGT
ncbi:MAG: chemotaxis protein, partial [Deltaproteobacteria bacterium]